MKWTSTIDRDEPGMRPFEIVLRVGSFPLLGLVCRPHRWTIYHGEFGLIVCGVFIGIWYDEDKP